MSTEQSATPLDTICQTFWQHTDRNPPDAEAVMALIQEAVSSLGDAAPQLAEDVYHNLNGTATGGMRTAGAALLAAIGELPFDPEAERAKQWGAIALLGVLGMSHDARKHRLLTSVRDPFELRSQGCGAMSRVALRRIVENSPDEQYQAMANALLDSPPVRPEDVAAELELHDFGAVPPPPEVVPEADEAVDDDELTLTGVSISERLGTSLSIVSDAAQQKIDKMDWLGVVNWNNLEGRIVSLDGERIALVVDLTVGHIQLRKFRQELDSSPNSKPFWNMLAMAVAQHAITKSCGKPLHAATVPTFYVGNIGSNANIVRGYYVPLGKGGVNGLEIFALIAAFRTKGPQAQVLRLISGTTQAPKH